MTRLLILAVAAVAGTGAQMRRADERPFIAFRYDADRVVIYTADDPRLPPPEPGQRRGLPPGLMPLASPRAALTRSTYR